MCTAVRIKILTIDFTSKYYLNQLEAQNDGVWDNVHPPTSLSKMKTAATPAAAATTTSRVVSSPSRVASLPGGAASLLLFMVILSFSSSSSKANHVRAPAGEDAVAAAAGLLPIRSGFGSTSARRATGSDGGGSGDGAEVRGDVGTREDDVGAGAADSALPPILSGFGGASRVVGGGSSDSGSGGDTNVMGGDDTMLPGMQQQQQERNGPSPPAKSVEPTTTPQRWIALNLSLDDGATSKIVRVKEGGTEEEVRHGFAYVCLLLGLSSFFSLERKSPVPGT